MSNPFEIFNLDPSFALDLKALDRHYFQLQKASYGCDASTSFAKNEHAALSAGAINMAYQTLKHPLSRAKALLGVLGIDMEEASESDRSQDATLLSDMLSFQEAMMMCEDEEEAAAIKEELDEHFVKSQHDFSENFDKGAHDGLVDAYTQMMYLSRLKAHMREIEARFFNRFEDQETLH